MQFESGLQVVSQKVRLEHLAIELIDELATGGIGAMLLKGPVLERWLYPGEIRPSRDVDLLIAPASRPRAVDILRDAGFRSWMLAPLSVDPGGTDFQRGDDVVDLHCAIPGLFGDPNMIWDELWAKTKGFIVAGVELPVPNQETVLLHVALHAGHHANFPGSKPFEDLRRAIDRASYKEWQRALELAYAYDGVAAFATGLHISSEGRPLARRLGLEDVRSFRFSLRRENNLIAEEIEAFFSSPAPIGHKMATIARELFPTPTYMRSWSPLARRGRFGLAAAYVWRPLWAASKVPRAVVTLWRVHREM